MTPEQISKEIELRAKFITKEQVYEHLAKIVSGAIKHHADLWDDDPKVREKNRKYMKAHFQEYRARERSAALFISKFIAPKQDPEPSQDKPKTITPEDIERMELSDEQLRMMAGIEEKK